MNTKITVPILLIGFNRPDNIEKVFERIRAAKPTKLYVAIDGARENKEGEDFLVNQVKFIVKSVDWDCEVQYRFNDSNLGAEVTISSAIKWVFEKEECAIILEDDIVVPFSFFEFMQEMLVKYIDVDIISSVSGSNFTPMGSPNGEDYFFCRYGHSWGWGTWRRVWYDFDLNMEIKKEHCTLDFTKTFTNSIAEAKYYQRLFSSLRKNGIGNNTWDFMGLYKHRVKGMLSVVPRVNLATNIGVQGLHARGATKYHFRPADENFKVQKHPDKIECWKEYDIYHFENHFPKRKSFMRRVVGYIKRRLKK